MKKIKNNSTIEKDILLLQEKGKNSYISIGEILNILSEKGQSLFILLFSLTFCQPLQSPGLSTPFGLAIAFIGLKMAFGKYAWLPQRILAKSITPQTLQKISEKLLWLLKKMNYWIYPRIIWLCYYPAMQIINGLLISILGILLALPLPIPFSNLMAAWPILFIGLGLLKDDGVFILMGYFVSLFTFGYFIAIFLSIKFIF
jgi:hypothetical protein